ncbi:Acg family FMN-binding oxidoreductase [Bifidobacterium aquikefiricola]|uniref:Nitroreductase n=1 Tax=Bifidobacterium aquikefiricola TaxID=3059038 RepID=A0AB39U7L5_9BIFI
MDWVFPAAQRRATAEYAKVNESNVEVDIEFTQTVNKGMAEDTMDATNTSADANTGTDTSTSTSTSTGIQRQHMLQFIRCATQAPSGHNTQPWKFRIHDGHTIDIVPDFAKTLPVVDTNNRELYISLGCALENLCIAAGHEGYGYDIVSQGKQGITIHLAKGTSENEDGLFTQIKARQTNRGVYSGRTMDDETLLALDQVRVQPDTRMYVAKIGERFADTLTQYIVQGNDMQMNDDDFKNELISWMRFTKGEVERMRDGLAHDVMGFPAIPRAVGRLIVGGFLKPRKQNESDLAKIRSSSHLVLLTTKHNTVSEWIDLGRTLESLLLTATKFNLAHAYLNPPCEIAALADGMRTALPIHEEYPSLIVRLGYADPMPCSPRQSVEKVIE